MNKPGKYKEPASKEDLDAFEQFFFKYYSRLQKFAVSILHNSSQAEDVVQDVFYQVWKDRVFPDPEKNIASYLFTILRNKCLNILRHKVVEEKYVVSQSKYNVEELYHISFRETDEFISMEQQLTRELENIISYMPSKCQQAFRLKWIEGKKIKEISGIMNISTTMVDRHLAKGLQIAREKLSSNMFIFFLIRCNTI